MHCPECGAVFQMAFLKQLYSELCKTFSVSKPRSVDQHRRFFGMIGKAYKQWPDQYEFQPLDTEHLRAWLLCRAGHRNVHTVDVNILAMSSREMALMKLAYETPFRQGKKKFYRFWHIHNERPYVVEPRSMSFDEMAHDDACKIMRTVDDEVCSILGITETDELFESRAA